jgi:hypothetical protein
MEHYFKGDSTGLMKKAYYSRLPALIDQVAAIYARTFSEAELRDMLSFARSPAGKAVQAKLPLLIEAERPLIFWAVGARMSEPGNYYPLPESAGSAPPPERLALAAQVVAAGRAAESVIDAPFRTARVMGEAMKIAGLSNGPADPKEEAEFAKANADSKARLGAFRPQIEQRLAWIYASTYTDEELAGQLAYFASPTGQAVVRRKPEVVDMGMALGMNVMKQAIADAKAGAAK